MSVLPIITLENPVLRRRAARVPRVTPELRRLIGDMIETMRVAPGVGLAAPQVAVGQRVIVVEYAEPPEADIPRDPADSPVSRQGTRPLDPPELYVVVNPEIVRRSRETETGNEGCLSIPGYYGAVDRHLAVTVKGLNRRGDPIRIKASGWLARIFQHEIDHLDGILFIDRAKEVWKVEEDEEGTGGGGG